MPALDIQRPNFYSGQFLHASDLVVAQEYERQQDQRHRLGAHTWGIAVGLELEERLRPGSTDAVDVYVKPGYAVDGFGRTITVFRPFKLSESLFASVAFDPNGAWVPVWLYYREEQTNLASVDETPCDTATRPLRVRESYRLLAGDFPQPRQQHDQISVAGKLVDAESEVPDASVPYQALPDPGDGRWFIRLGTVRWRAPNPPATTVGQFVKSATQADQNKGHEGRRWTGVVAASLLAPARTLRIADRFADPLPSNPVDPRYGGVAVKLEGSLEVDRLLTAKQDVHVEGKVGLGTNNPAGRLTINGTVQPQQGSLTIFSNDADFVYDGGNDQVFIFKDTGGKTAFMGGNVGIGTTNPTEKLEVAGNLKVSGLINGHDLDAELNALAQLPGSNVEVITGEVAHGDLISPANATLRNFEYWFVGLKQITLPAAWLGAYYEIECSYAPPSGLIPPGFQKHGEVRVRCDQKIYDPIFRTTTLLATQYGTASYVVIAHD